MGSGGWMDVVMDENGWMNEGRWTIDDAELYYGVTNCICTQYLPTYLLYMFMFATSGF